MRVVKYPEPEKEEFITCPKCEAELAYNGSDCYWKDGIAGAIKYIVCPCCNYEIKVSYTPYQSQTKKLEFYY